MQEYNIANTEVCYYLNKRAHRALGRSDEKKVKGHSGAIFRGPLILYTKYHGSCRL